ncbi:hypothetical protein HN51_066640 [Arachis hypogaea]|nr:Receptor-like protein [Arachis hypogaea]
MSLHRVLSFLVSFCLINLIISINVHVVTGHSLVHQESLLLHLKESLQFNPVKSKKLVHWNESDSYCQWTGVSCNKGHVIGLDLSEEFITGGLNNSSLFNLHYLQSLNLAYNVFRSPIPSEIKKLKNLKHLNLSNAGFYGQIPKEISYLKNLVTLDLSTPFTSQNTLELKNPNVAIYFQNLTEIKELYLDGVRVSSGGKEWCRGLSLLRKLQVLSMASCNLSGPIDSSLSKLRSLRVIRLNLNNMSSSVPKFFVDFANLTTLQLGNCGLTGVFPKGIFQIQALKILDVSDNEHLQGSLPELLQDGYLLEALNLSNTNFSGQLVSSISNLKHLSTLDLSDCQFNGTLSASLSELAKLVHLDLSFNKFTGFLPSFNKSKNLQYLSLFHNELNGVVSSTLWEGLSNLHTIDLGDNFFSGRVPSTLFTLPSLQELTLSHNEFEGFLDEFPNATNSKLELVDISINKLQGPIPMSFSLLKRLSLLQLSLNQFNGTIKLERFQTLPNLDVLGLSHNNLLVDATTIENNPSLPPFPRLSMLLLASCKLKEFPSFLRNQSQLRLLDLSNNQIHGTIPKWIWKFEFMIILNLSKNFLTDLEKPFENPGSNLLRLDLHSNQLQGTVPMITKYGSHLDYSSNKFNSFPSDIHKYLQFTYLLSFSNNSFGGQIPESFCNSSSLRLLDLSHNNFDGSIPECLTARNDNLRVLNLAGNKLTGHIPDTLSNSCNLRVIDLDSNTLVGAIPKSLAYCQKLQVLNLGNNMLNNEFPCFLGNISTLRVLILRSNRLQGPIRCQHSTNNWEMLHIVDLASNNLTGMVSGSLLQRWTKMMGDDNEAHKRYGSLFFDMFDNHDTIRFKDLITIIDRVIVMKLNQMLVGESPSVVDHLFAYLVTANELGGRYLDSVTVVNKGSHRNFITVPSIFTALDLSSNHLEGSIPEELVNLRALHVLNLSHNAFSGHIPSSIGNLMNLESMDLSYNNLSGRIPTEISSLYFLSVLNLSFNHLVGEIPTGSQIQTFDAYSFEGNDGLCGLPLTKNCGENGIKEPLSPSSEKKTLINWSFLSVELGFTFGFGLIILPLIFWKRWRLWYCKNMDDLLHKIFPQLEFVYEQLGEQRYRNLRWIRG